MSWEPPCILCGHTIATGTGAGTDLPKHATCDRLHKSMSMYRFRITWRGKLVLQQRIGLDYRDCRINNMSLKNLPPLP